MMRKIWALLLSAAALFVPANGFAESSTESKFQELFITAGYSTAFGAALAAASLSFRDEPSQHLNDIAVGASVGFIAGSILGTYLAVTDRSSASEHLGNSSQIASIRLDPLIKVPHTPTATGQLGLEFTLLVR